MKIACLGGGPAGLYFAISMKLRDAAHDITVFERNRPDDTFGWGVVFSDETFDNITANDPVSAATIRAHFAYWDDIAVHYRGQRIVSSGHGFSGIARKKLLMLLQQRARELGVKLVFRTEIASAGELAENYDLVVAADGLNSKTRAEFAHYFQAGHRQAQEQIRLARHQSEIRRRLHFHLRRNRARLDLGARLPVRRRHRDLHRRMLRGDLGEVRLRRDEPGGKLPRLRTHLRQISRRPSPDVECGAYPRLGVAELSPRALREVVAPQHRADGRCRRHGAFFDRLGNQARHGERGLDGELSAHRADHAGGVREIRE